MKAVILAGGKGTRLHPVTCELPKPMVPVFNIPLMEHLILLLKKHGIRDIGVTLMYLPQKISSYFGDGSRWGVRLSYFVEESPCGTAGSLLSAAEFLNEPFLVLSGDCITDINLTEAIEFHRRKKTLATLVLTSSGNPRDYGIVITDQDGHIVSFLEKPSLCEVFSDIVNTGIYMLEPDVLNYIESDHPFDFSRELFPKLLSSGLRLSGYPAAGYWSDIGSVENYLNAHRDIFDRKTDLFPYSQGGLQGVFTGKSTVIEPTALIHGPCVIGNNCYIGHRAMIDSYTVIGNDCIIEDQVLVKRSILHNNITVGSGCEIRQSILGNRVRLMPYVSCLENTVVGEESVIHERSIIKPGVRIWPSKTVGPFSVVNRSIIHSFLHHSSLFHNGRIVGGINADITPEVASRLGSAFGSVLGAGKRVIVASDATDVSCLFEYAFASGMISTGVQVFSLHGVSIPVSRMAIRDLNLSGGIHIHSEPASAEKLIIDFLDEAGANLDSIAEKTIEAVFYKEDFSRCHPCAVPSIVDMEEYKETYIRSVVSGINTTLIQAKPPVLFVMSDSEAMLSFVCSVFDRLCIPIAGEMRIDRLDPDSRRNIEHSLHADLTAFIDSSGEQLQLMDSCGRIPDENQLFLLRAYMLMKNNPGIKIAAPLNMTCTIERMALRYGGSVKRTKISGYDLIRELLRESSFAQSTEQYLLYHDALVSLAKTIEFLCMNNINLDDLIRLTPSCNIRHSSFLCPYESIGMVMRTLYLENGRQLLGGIRIQREKSWALIIPDSEKPEIHLYTEGRSGSEAVRLLREYSERISALLPVTKYGDGSFVSC